MIVSLMKSSGQQVSVVDNIRVQPFEFTGKDKSKNDKMIPMSKGFSRDHVMVSLGKGVPCQPMLRTKLQRINVTHLVTNAYRDGLPMRLTLNF